MKLKEKVLKEVLKVKWDGRTKEDKLGFGLSKTIDLTLTEAEKQFIRRTKKGICLICKKKDKFSKETVCGDCSLKWLEKKGKLKDYIKRAEVGKVIDDFPLVYIDLIGKEKLKQKLGIK